MLSGMAGRVGWQQDRVDGAVLDPLHPADYTVLPEPAVVRERADEAMAAAAILRPDADVFDALCRVFAGELSDTGLVDALVVVDRLKAHLDARQAELLSELAARDPDGQEFLQDELGCALRLAPGTAAGRVEVARQLTGRLRVTGERVRAGRISWVHGRILATACHDLTDGVTGTVQQRVLRRAERQTPGEFAASVRRAIAALDARDQAEQHRAAVEKRHASIEHVEDGMSWLTLFLPRDGAELVWTAIAARAVTTDSADDRTADQRRADSIVEIAQAALANPDPISQHGIRPTITITLAATTMAGLDQQPGLIGDEPIPADLARRFARHPDARHYYQLVNDAGQVLDRCAVATGRGGRADRRKYDRADDAGRAGCHAGTERGLRTDSYSPTTTIARHVITRDQHCVLPGCRRKAQHCDLDHRLPWPAGDTSADNLQPLCTRHHKMKHQSGWQIHRDEDGTYAWTSPTKHTYHYRPPEQPVPEPAALEPAALEPPPPDEDPPPF
jgi:hypothetical protein